MLGIDLRQVRRKITIRQVLDLLGFVPTARYGPRLRGPCPIHGDCRPQSRVFSVHLGCHRYRCFRCHSAGTQLDLWAAVHNLSISRSRCGSLSPSRHPGSVLACDQRRPPSRQVTGSLLAAVLAQRPAAAVIHSLSLTSFGNRLTVPKIDILAALENRHFEESRFGT